MPKLVCIGGSTEGMAALERLVSFLPSSTGLSFLIAVDDAAPGFAARLQEQTVMPVEVAAGPTLAQPDRVYIATQGQQLAFADGQVTSAVAFDAYGARCSIDRLFRCIASERGASAVGIVLAGDGTDGMIGLKLLKESGGVTMVQLPAEAVPDEMPRMAVATGLVDFVLPLEAIATKLGNGLAHEVGEPGAAWDDQLREILVLLRVRTGHDFTQYKRSTLSRRVARRMQVTNCTDLDDYLRHARQEPSELAALLRDFMISVTNFFRDPDAFDVINNVVLPTLFDSDPAEPIRIWIAGCATGEEAYSWGMLLLEKRAELAQARQIQIFASDIDDEALDDARRGRYPNTIAVDVSAERLERFFTRDGEFFRVAKDLRELVLFASHNMLRDAPFSRLDVVSCRNVLIYLDRAMQENVLRTAHFALRPDRVLVLGSSETADTPEGLFKALDAKHRIFVRQPKLSLVLPSMGPKPRWEAPPFATARDPEVRAHTPGELHHRMVERYAPPSVLVNERLELIHISERANRYLQVSPGEPTRDIFQLVLPDLRLDLRATVYSARRAPGVAVSATTHADIAGEPRSVRLGVQAEAASDSSHGNLLIWFEEGPVRSEAAAVQSSAPDHSHIEPIVEHLEEELRHTRDQLRSTIEQYETLVEELHASNEELQAINEELRSASEEIEAGREETDSVNQELTTVNLELKLRIQETSAAKSDIANLMESSDVGVIFLDRELRIQRFTRRTRQIFNILDSDLGRPLTDLTPMIEYPGLPADTRQVLQSMTPVEREVLARDGSSYLVRTRPYRTIDDRIAGIVMTFMDITALRRIEDALRNKEAMLELAQRAANAGVWELDARARLRMSEQCHHLYGTARSPSAVDSAAWTANVFEEERPALLEAIASVLRSGPGGLDVEFRVRHPEFGERWLWMLGRKTDSTSDVAGITLDVTAARVARRALEEADRRKNEFIATLAHELRNPLTPLAMALDILKLQGDDPEAAKTARELMERQVAQLRRLVDDLLDLSRIQTGRLDLRIQRGLPLREIIDHAVQAVRPLTDELEHTVEVRVAEDVHIDGDPLRLGQIFVNLLTNAAKYTEPRGTITVTATVQAPHVLIAVKDTGVGIPVPVLSKIFEVFVQAEPITTRSRGGLGIGLSLVRQLVLLHGGSIIAESEGEGRGSCFTVTLPLTVPE